MKYKLILLFLMLVLNINAYAAIQTKEVNYQAGDTLLKGYLAYDDSTTEKRPGVLVVHEWWGLNKHARNSADKLAALGYTAFAVDMYGDGKTAGHPKEAGEFSQALMSQPEVAKQRFEAALEYLKQDKTVNPEKIAAIGYCFGGAIVLNRARTGEDLDAVVSFHGSLDTQTPAEPGKVKSKVLVLTGGDDPTNPPEKVEAFRQEMEKASVNYQVISYPDAKHSFTNPEADELSKKFSISSIAYNSKATEESWQAMSQFLEQVFK